MRQYQATLKVSTPDKSLHLITSEIQSVVRDSGVNIGLCVVYICHTSASLLIQENADPDVLADLEMFFSKLVPESLPYRHANEGSDDMPAHIRSALTKTSETIPIVHGQLGLGLWQGIYVWEHRTHHHQRELIIHVMGEP